MPPKKKQLKSSTESETNTILLELDNAVNYLEHTIADFPVGASTPDDFKPIETKIVEIRESLKAIDARNLTLKAVIDIGMREDEPMGDLVEALNKLNENTFNHLINTRTLSLCLQSRAIQDIIYKDAGTKDIQEQTKLYLRKLYTLNDKMSAKDEKIKELTKKQFLLKLECHRSIYDYQDFLKKKEAKRNKELQEMNPNFVTNKEKLNRAIFKINTMKKLVTNLIASMSKELDDKSELVDMLSKHKNIINLEVISEMV